jgi:hypothetical protein
MSPFNPLDGLIVHLFISILFVVWWALQVGYTKISKISIGIGGLILISYYVLGYYSIKYPVLFLVLLYHLYLTSDFEMRTV